MQHELSLLRKHVKNVKGAASHSCREERTGREDRRGKWVGLPTGTAQHYKHKTVEYIYVTNGFNET
jgi:hypothetical protein